MSVASVIRGNSRFRSCLVYLKVLSGCGGNCYCKKYLISRESPAGMDSHNPGDFLLGVLTNHTVHNQIGFL